MTRTGHAICIFLGIAFAALVASGFIVIRAEAEGVGFVPTLIVSFLLAIVVPVVAVIAFRKVGLITGALPTYLVFFLCSALVLGVLSRWV